MQRGAERRVAGCRLEKNGQRAAKVRVATNRAANNRVAKRRLAKSRAAERWAEGQPEIGLAAQAGEELGGVDGFEEDFEFVAAEAGIVEEVGGGGLAREEQDAAVGDEGADLDGGVDAGDAGHDDVGEEDVGVEGAGGIDGVLAAVDGGSLKAVLGEDQAKGIGDDAFIVGHEDTRPRRRAGSRVHGALRNDAQKRGKCGNW